MISISHRYSIGRSRIILNFVQNYGRVLVAVVDIGVCVLVPYVNRVEIILNYCLIGAEIKTLTVKENMSHFKNCLIFFLMGLSHQVSAHAFERSNSFSLGDKISEFQPGFFVRALADIHVDEFSIGVDLETGDSLLFETNISHRGCRLLTRYRMSHPVVIPAGTLFEVTAITSRPYTSEHDTQRYPGPDALTFLQFNNEMRWAGLGCPGAWSQEAFEASIGQYFELAF